MKEYTSHCGLCSLGLGPDLPKSGERGQVCSHFYLLLSVDAKCPASDFPALLACNTELKETFFAYAAFCQSILSHQDKRYWDIFV